MSHLTAAHVRSWHDELAKLEDQINGLQEAKKRTYERIRRDFDRRTAEGMKAAMKFLRMDERKRLEFFEFSNTGREFISLIDGVDEQVEDWRERRERKRAEPFDPERPTRVADNDLTGSIPEVA